MNKFETFFKNNLNTLQISKWHHYFDIYERHFSKYQNMNPNILEIGTAEGGGTEMINYYFENNCEILTIDIDQPQDPEIKTKFKNIKFLQGDQANNNFLNAIKTANKKFDIIIDDGGHGMDMQITTFKALYEHLSDIGTYLIEDVHTSYWPEYSGGVERQNTFIEFTKKLIDRLNTWHWKQSFTEADLIFCKQTDSIHYYDSVVVIEKRPDANKPICEGKKGWDKPGHPGRIWDDNSDWISRLIK